MLLAFLDYNLSTALWVGLIAVAGVAAETGIVMVVYGGVPGRGVRTVHA